MLFCDYEIQKQVRLNASEQTYTFPKFSDFFNVSLFCLNNKPTDRPLFSQIVWLVLSKWTFLYGFIFLYPCPKNVWDSRMWHKRLQNLNIQSVSKYLLNYALSSSTCKFKFYQGKYFNNLKEVIPIINLGSFFWLDCYRSTAKCSSVVPSNQPWSKRMNKCILKYFDWTQIKSSAIFINEVGLLLKSNGYYYFQSIRNNITRGGSFITT